jgi:exodeoxyribonuclease VII small subunit
MPKPAQNRSPDNFELALGELESIVQNMETGKLSLEDSLAAYQRGVTLLKYCQTTLATAEQKIQALDGEELREFPAPDSASG